MHGAATQIASHEFDALFFSLPAAAQERIQRKIDRMGLKLASSRHCRMVGSDKYRLRVGDYRVVYRFDPAKSEIVLFTVGHRREVYRNPL